MPRSNQVFAAAKPASADAQTLALIASSLVLATIVAFLAMILTAWPAAAQGQTASPRTLQLAALPPSAAPGRTMMQATPTAQIAAPAAPRQVDIPRTLPQTVSLQTVPQIVRPCAEELAAADAETNATLAKFEALEEAEMGLQCTALRDHLAALSRAVTVADRCTTGHERATKVNLIRQNAAEWRGVVSSSCR
ncbi:MAG: hypothetical protein J0H01_31090 [Rhizobiales bacterium]|nr:hypothetical protein [Hyphomicrobiales bacterium]